MPGPERDLPSLLDLGSRLDSLPRAERLGAAVQSARLLFECDGATVLSVHRRGFERLALGPGTPAPSQIDPGGEAATRWLANARQPMRFADLAAEVRFGRDGCPGVDAGPTLFVPLGSRGLAAGYLAIFRVRGRPAFTESDARQLTLLGAWTGLAIENLRLSEQVEKLAITDDLTQIYNYRYLKTALRREIRRASRFSQQLSLLMLDVDHLKTYNDRHGHLRGSFVLKHIAQILLRSLRSFDLIAKYGGDEFTVILPQTPRDGAAVVAERMRNEVANTKFPLEPRGAITVSLGVATFPEDATEGLALVRAADRALYRAKQAGRNRIELQSEAAA